MIATQRLKIREFKSSDWKAVHIYASNAEILKYESWGPNTEAETKAFIQKTVAAQQVHPRVDFEMAVTLLESGVLIGGVGFRINLKKRTRGDFGYCFNPDYWNTGYATEAAQALIEYMVNNHGIKQIEATCDIGNLASKRVIEKCGLKITEVVENDIEMKGRMRDSFYFKKIM